MNNNTDWGEYIPIAILLLAFGGVIAGSLFGIWVLCGLPDYGLGGYFAFAFLSGFVTLTIFAGMH